MNPTLGTSSSGLIRGKIGRDRMVYKGAVA
jgi:hypothetical protein